MIYVLIAYFLILVAARTGTAYVSPEPLPRVSLHLRGDPSVRHGSLIVTPGDAWYVTTQSRTYLAVPASRVTSAFVRSREREREPRPVLKVAWDWLTG